MRPTFVSVLSVSIPATRSNPALDAGWWRLSDSPQRVRVHSNNTLSVVNELPGGDYSVAAIPEHGGGSCRLEPSRNLELALARADHMAHDACDVECGVWRSPSDR